jgi:formylglycine-generating enzyme required for sulfatase activity
MKAVAASILERSRMRGEPAGRGGTWALVVLTANVLFCTGCGHVAASKAPEAKPEIVKTKSGIEMVVLPAGSFTMGSEHGEANETVRQAVAVDPILVDRYEVTQEEYEKLVIGNPSKFKDPKNPVERVRWVEAALYCNGRSAAEGLQPCYDENTFACNFAATGYRLPTEAEWEYACRAGADAEYSFGSDASRLGDYAWFRDNSSERTHPVGTKRPNPWGLFDMYGNVGEWCQDVYDEHYDPMHPKTAASSANGGPKRTLRGGAWSSSPSKCRSSSRSGEAPGNFADACFARADIGFRCVRRAPAPSRVEEVAAKGRAGTSETGAQATESVARP